VRRGRDVTKVEAMIRTDCLDAVVERLLLIGVRGLTVTSVEGFGRTSGHESVFRGVAYRIDFQPKTMLEWVGPDDDVDGVIRAILRTAATGRIGDGKIFVTPVDEAVRIRTGERGDAAM
jgi:nitrogen regulatory protein P-II 1